MFFLGQLSIKEDKYKLARKIRTSIVHNFTKIALYKVVFILRYKLVLGATGPCSPVAPGVPIYLELGVRAPAYLPRKKKSWY